MNPEPLVWGPQQQVFLDLHSKAAGECNPATRAWVSTASWLPAFLPAAAA